MHLMYFTEQPMSAYPVAAGKDFGAILRCDEALRRKGAETFIPQLRAVKLPPS